MNLIAKKRDLSVKPDALRADGLIPAELYGHGFENLHLAVPTKEFAKVFKEAGESTVVSLEVEGEKESINVLIHDVSHNALTGDVAHIDFYHLRMDEKITAQIPVVFTGESIAVKEKGGLLVKAMQEIEVEALPANLPHEIKVDISSIVEIGDSIRVSDLNLPAGVKISVDPETVVATVIIVKEEAPAAVATEAVVAPAATAEKKEE